MREQPLAPTWNYASAQFFVDVEFFDDPQPLEAHMRALADTMESTAKRAPDSSPWNVDQMGPRYASLSRGVIGFGARVREVRARFKLGQTERDDVFRDHGRHGTWRRHQPANLDERVQPGPRLTVRSAPGALKCIHPLKTS